MVQAKCSTSCHLALLMIVAWCSLTAALYTQTGDVAYRRQLRDEKYAMKSLCRRAQKICTRGTDESEVRSANAVRASQYKRIIAILKQLNEDVKRDKRLGDDDDIRRRENSRANIA